MEVVNLWSVSAPQKGEDASVLGTVPFAPVSLLSDMGSCSSLPSRFGMEAYRCGLVVGKGQSFKIKLKYEQLLAHLSVLSGSC